MVRTGGTTGQAQFDVAAISGLAVDVARSSARPLSVSRLCWVPRPCLVIQDAPAGITTGDASKPTPLSLLTPDGGTEEIARQGSPCDDRRRESRARTVSVGRSSYGTALAGIGHTWTVAVARSLGGGLGPDDSSGTFRSSRPDRREE